MTDTLGENVTRLLFNVTLNSTYATDFDGMVPIWSRIVAIIFMLITGILAVFGNGIILLVERKNKCKTSTDWLVCCMAVNDIVFAIINIPVHVILQLGSWKSLGSDPLCKMHVFVQRTTTYSSTLLLCAIAVDRYWKTCRPHSKFLTQQRSFRVCVLITVISCIVCSPLPLIVVYDEPFSCSHVGVGGALTKIVTSVVSFTFVIMFAIVCLCYIKIAWTIKHKLLQSGLRTDRSEQLDERSTKQKSIVNKSHVLFNIKAKKPQRITQLRNCKVVPTDLKCGNDEFQDIQPSREIVSNQSNNNQTATTNTSPVDSDGCHASGSETVKQQMKRLRLTDANVNRTTKIMFAVTLVFLLSWAPTWISVFYEQVKTQESVVERIFVFFGNKVFMVNAFTNPIFYIWLSSVFKERAKNLLAPLCICW